MRRSIAFASAFCYLHATASSAQDAGEAYHARLALSGYLLRSSVACKMTSAQAKRSVDVAMRYAYTGEVRDFTKGFPKTAERWMQDGAGRFNDEVMTSGLTATCQEANRLGRQAP